MITMKKILIIGGGPAGLNLAIKLKERNIDYLILEASEALGGQITELYPHKEIVDLPNIDSIIAQDYISSLVKKIDLDKVVFKANIVDIKHNDNGVVAIDANHMEYRGSEIVIATGLGFFTPRKMGLEKEDEFSNILYSVKDFSFLKNKRVAIFGGGDSALDWAKEISRISDNVSLIHRRMEFRGNADTIKDCHNLKVYLPYVPFKLIIKEDNLIGITIKNVNEESYIDIDIDYILVNYGNVSSPLILPVEKEGNYVKVDNNMKNTNHIYSIGDVTTYENKKRRIAPALEEIDRLLKVL